MDHSAICSEAVADIVHRLRLALQRVNAHPDGNNWVYWTSLREVCSVICTLGPAEG